MRKPSSWIAVSMFAFILLGGLALSGGGVFELLVLEKGAPARASVSECHPVGGRYTVYACQGTWVAGGPLVGGGGHVVTGTVDGAGPDDVGKTIDVRLWGDRAYTPSLRVPITLLVLGLGMMAVSLGVARPLAWPRSAK